MKLTNIVDEEYNAINEKLLVDKPNVRRDLLLCTYETWKKKGVKTTQYKPLLHKESYENAYLAAETIPYDRNEITDFCFAIDPTNEELESQKWSIFTSALMNKLYKYEKEKNQKKQIAPFTLVTKHFSHPLQHFGFQLNGPRVIVLGDLGGDAGLFMQRERYLFTEMLQTPWELV